MRPWGDFKKGGVRGRAGEAKCGRAGLTGEATVYRPVESKEATMQEGGIERLRKVARLAVGGSCSVGAGSALGNL